MKEFVIGYGSLINLSSLQRTLQEKSYTEPVLVKGHLRAWEASDLLEYKPITYLNARKSRGDSFNGVIFEISKDELTLLDKREVLYDRYSISKEKVELLAKDSHFNLSKDDLIWIYSAKKPHFPSEEFPISLSYVTTCLKGCLDIQKRFDLENFVDEFVKTTKKWSTFWKMDEEVSQEIKDLLKGKLPEGF